MLILVKNIKTTLALVKILIVLDFGQNLQKSRIWSKFTKMWILDKIAEMLIIVKIFKNVDLGQNLQIPRIWSKFSKKLDFH